MASEYYVTLTGLLAVPMPDEDSPTEELREAIRAAILEALQTKFSAREISGTLRVCGL